MTEPDAVTEVGATLAGIFQRHPVADLTLPLDETLPSTWPGHMPYRATVWSWFADRPDDPQPVHPRGGGHYQTRWLVVDEHTGTHVDAPRHFVPPPGSGLPHAGPAGAVGVADLALLATSGPAAVIDVRDLAGQAEPGHSPAITPGHVTAFESQHGPLRGGDVVLFRTGWDSRYRPGRTATPTVPTCSPPGGHPAGQRRSPRRSNCSGIGALPAPAPMACRWGPLRAGHRPTWLGCRTA